LFYTTTLGFNVIEGKRCLGLDNSKQAKRENRIILSEPYLSIDEKKRFNEYVPDTISLVTKIKCGLFDVRQMTLNLLVNILPSVPNIVGRYGDTDPEIKSYNNALTKWINNSQVSYLISMNTIVAVAKAIKKTFPEHVRNKDIFLVLKGGCVWGDSLLERVGSAGLIIEGVRALFKSGDNDTGIYINPSLSFSKNIYVIVQDIVHNTLIEEADKYSIGSDRWNSIEKSLDTEMPFPCVFEERSDIVVEKKDLLFKEIKQEKVHNRYVYVSRNDLEFVNGGSIVSFALIRLKIALRCCRTGRRLSAELVDVSVSDPEEDFMQDTFDNYRRSIIPYKL
jgi:hypothetical protein